MTGEGHREFSLILLLADLTGLERDLMLSLHDSPETTLLLLRIQNDPQLARLDGSVLPGEYTEARLLDALHDLSQRGLVECWLARHEGAAPAAGLPEYERGRENSRC